MTPVRLQWGEILMPLLKKYKLNITWGDQDLLNIMFFHNPGKSALILSLKLSFPWFSKIQENILLAGFWAKALMGLFFNSLKAIERQCWSLLECN